MLDSQCQEVQPSSCAPLRNHSYLCSSGWHIKQKIFQISLSLLCNKKYQCLQTQKSIFSYLKKLATIIHPVLGNFAVLQAKGKSSSLTNVSKTNITLPVSIRNCKAGLESLLFFLAWHIFLLQTSFMYQIQFLAQLQRMGCPMARLATDFHIWMLCMNPLMIDGGQQLSYSSS